MPAQPPLSIRPSAKLEKLMQCLSARRDAAYVPMPALYGSWGVFLRELLRIRRIWVQAILSPVLLSLLTIFAFVQMQAGGLTQNFQHLRALLAAYTVASVIQHASGNVMSSLFPTKYHGTLESLLMSPTPREGIIFGYALGGVFKSLLVQSLIAFIVNIYSPLHIASWTNLSALLIICAMIYSLLGVLIALLARSFDDLSFITTFLILPSTLLSGRFFSLEVLPWPIKTLLRFNPLNAFMQAVQEAWLGPVFGPPISLMLLYPCALALIALLFYLNQQLLARGYGNQFR